MDDRKLKQWLDDENEKARIEKFAAMVGKNVEANTQEPLSITSFLPGAPIQSVFDPAFSAPHFDGQQYTFPNEPIFVPTLTVSDISKEDKRVSDGGSSSYYELPEGATELQDLIEHRNMNFAIGNIFKACYRQGQKTGIDAIYDINKIIWYAEREKARLEREMNNGNNDSAND